MSESYRWYQKCKIVEFRSAVNYIILCSGTNEVNVLQPFNLLFRSCAAFAFSVCIFVFRPILLSRESDRSAIMSSLRSCRSFVHHTKMGESRLVLFPKKQVKLPACFFHPFNAECSAWKLKIQIL